MHSLVVFGEFVLTKPLQQHIAVTTGILVAKDKIQLQANLKRWKHKANHQHHSNSNTTQTKPQPVLLYTTTTCGDCSTPLSLNRLIDCTGTFFHPKSQPTQKR